MSALAAARRYEVPDVLRARVALARAHLRLGLSTSEVVAALQRECGVCERTAFRVLRRARILYSNPHKSDLNGA